LGQKEKNSFASKCLPVLPQQPTQTSSARTSEKRHKPTLANLIRSPRQQ
jgi:hypothetical protein